MIEQKWVHETRPYSLLCDMVGIWTHGFWLLTPINHLVFFCCILVTGNVSWLMSVNIKQHKCMFYVIYVCRYIWLNHNSYNTIINKWGIKWRYVLHNITSLEYISVSAKVINLRGKKIIYNSIKLNTKL